ncbi:MAG: hypothetical protein A2Z02_02545 [Chloroflexi bacterium RBG_16_48_7]|nr:MAG: hypothetical protein A2Z02_02545 [Chloroflexi bacterium RBG_16_48_7]
MKRRHTVLEIPCSTNFITTTIVNFEPVFHNKPLVDLLIRTINYCCIKYHVQINGYVIMPNLVHLLASVMSAFTISIFLGQVKEYSAKQIINWFIINEKNSYLDLFSSAAAESKQGHRYQVWQKRFDNAVITRGKDMIIKLDYIHCNPLRGRWNLCSKPEEYPFSSAKYYYEGKETGIPITKISSCE